MKQIKSKIISLVIMLLGALLSCNSLPLSKYLSTLTGGDLSLNALLRLVEISAGLLSTDRTENTYALERINKLTGVDVQTPTIEFLDSAKKLKAAILEAKAALNTQKESREMLPDYPIILKIKEFPER